ncbi:FtsX-like permease family protein [bacterium]|nr:FtsX-like permease family protein [bacterium]
MRVLNRKLIRDMLKARGQVIAVCAVIMCGIAGYSSVLSAFRNLKLTRDTYYKEYRFADFTIMMEKAPVSAVLKVRDISGVAVAQGRIVKDVNLDIPGSDVPKIGRIISLPGMRQGLVNSIYLASGRYFSEAAMDEVIVNDSFLKKNGLRIGDRIHVLINNKRQSLRIIGTALSPEYVYMVRNSQEFIPGPERFAVLWVRYDFAEMAFDMGGACNEIVGLLEDAGQVYSQKIPERLKIGYRRGTDRLQPEDSAHTFSACLRSGDALDDITALAEKMLEPYGYFTTVKRDDQLSNRYLSDEIKGLAVTARIWPGLFLCVAAVILMIMLGRMVKRERTEIGILKAYGYSRYSVALHYVKFALVISTAGSILGFISGQLLGRGMIGMYVRFFQFPVLRHRFYPDIFITSIIISSIFALIGALGAVAGTFRISPAEAMRPESPAVYRSILLERLGILWGRLAFTWKVIMRNIFRYKFRSSFTIFGVAISTALLLLGYLSADSMSFLIDNHFKEVQREDVRVSLEGERPKDALRELQSYENVIKAEPLFEYPFTLRSGWREKDLLITGVMQDSDMLHILGTGGERIYTQGDGLILNDRTAKEMGLSVGDQVTMKPLMGKIKKETKVRVADIASQYLGLGAYMNIHALSRLMGEPFVMNAALLRVADGTEYKINKAFKDVPAIAAVVLKSDTIKGIEETLAASMDIMNIINIILAGVIALAVIYNSTSISITERKRDLASLRVLGFTRKEAGDIVFNENYMLSAIGLLTGLPLGLFLFRLIIKLYETDLYRLPVKVNSISCWITSGIIVAFVFAANRISGLRIRDLDMIEALKSRE